MKKIVSFTVATVLTIAIPTVLAAKKPAMCATGHCQHHESRISFGPYFYEDEAYDGSSLLSDSPKVREAEFLLKSYSKLYAKCKLYGVPLPKYPRVNLSGYVEGSWSYKKNYDNSDKKTLAFTGAEIISYFQATPWLSAFIAYDYDTALTNSFRVDMYRAYVILGDLQKFPIFTAVGQMYLPFGKFSSLMAKAPYTQTLGRFNDLAWETGYAQTGDDALHAESFLYRSDDNHRLGGGADLGYDFVLDKLHATVGASVISNLADSQGMHANVFTDGVAEPNYDVPAIDLYASLSYESWILNAEYVDALRRFHMNDLAYENHGAKPSAYHVELGYLFKTFGKPSNVAIGYDHTSEALDLGVPQQAESVVYNISVIKNSNLGIEFQRGYNYPVSAASTGENPKTLGLGQSSDEILAVFDYYF